MNSFLATAIFPPAHPPSRSFRGTPLYPRQGGPSQEGLPGLSQKKISTEPKNSIYPLPAAVAYYYGFPRYTLVNTPLRRWKQPCDLSHHLLRESI